MQDFVNILVSIRDTFSSYVVFSLGILLIFGYFLGRLAQLLKLPPITGYIVAGLILGDSLTGIIHVEMSQTLRAVTDVALGIIAITIGGEFGIQKLRRLGKQIVVITLVQLLATFGVVSIALIIFRLPVVYSLLLGAVASATAPAATVVIIEELRARGDFVDTLYGIVALDDVGCIILFALVFALANKILGSGGSEAGFMGIIGHAATEIGLSLFVGLLGGFILHFLISRSRSSNESLILSFGVILLVTAVAVSLKLSPLLANMMAGAVLVNISPKGQRALRALAPLTPPLYAAFFAIAGTELKLGILGTMSVLVPGIVYVLSRAAGKYIGVWTGATVVHSDKKVRNYLGLSMLPQAGVAIGLVLFVQATPLAAQAPPEIKLALSQMVNIVLFAVLINELTGPPLSKYAIVKGAEL